MVMQLNGGADPHQQRIQRPLTLTDPSRQRSKLTQFTATNIDPATDGMQPEKRVNGLGHRNQHRSRGP
jgi:hypothetical protein